jgi:hypothetical protein
MLFLPFGEYSRVTPINYRQLGLSKKYYCFFTMDICEGSFLINCSNTCGGNLTIYRCRNDIFVTLLFLNFDISFWYKESGHMPCRDTWVDSFCDFYWETINNDKINLNYWYYRDLMPFYHCVVVNLLYHYGLQAYHMVSWRHATYQYNSPSHQHDESTSASN